MLVRMQRNRIPHTLLVGMWKAQLLWKTVWQCVLKSKHASTLWPSNGIPGHLFQRNENLHSPQSLNTEGHRSFICEIQKLESAQRVFNRRMVKQTGIRPPQATTQSWKGTNHWYIQQLGSISKKSRWARKASPQRLHILSSHLYNILKRQHFRNRGSDGCQGLGTGQGGGEEGRWLWSWKSSTRDSWEIVTWLQWQIHKATPVIKVYRS